MQTNIEREILDKESAAIAIGGRVIVIIEDVRMEVEEFRQLAARFSCHCNSPFERYKNRNYYYFDFKSPFSDKVMVRVKHYERHRRDFIIKAI